MSILDIQTEAPTGLASVSPQIIYILTDDTYAVVTASGYLTAQKSQGYTFSDQQMALVYTSDEGPVWLKIVISYSGSSVLNTVVSLEQISSPGDVTLPTIANHIMVSTDTVGTLANLTGTAISNGSLQAGLSGTAGALRSYPSTAANGYLALTAGNNSGGDFATFITNASSVGQQQTISIPDAGAATANFAVAPAALVDGNVITASGTDGLVQDGGFAVLANTTAAYGGGGTSNAFTATGVGATSIVTASILASTNAVSIVKVVPTADTLTVDFSADPGAATTVSWIAITPAV